MADEITDDVFPDDIEADDLEAQQNAVADAVAGQVMTYTVDDALAGKRVDQALAGLTPENLSRSRIHALIEQGVVSVNGVALSGRARKVVAGDTLSVVMPKLQDPVPQPQNIPLDIVYEDDSLLVINKPAGLVVHPGAGNPDGTLVNALLYHCGDTLSGIGGVKRPGIVHRLDKDTSGLIMVAKTDKAHRILSAQLSDRSLTRLYAALTWGVPPLVKGVIDKPIGRNPTNRLKMSIRTKSGKEAITEYRVVESFYDCASYLECKLRTGRTHQIRVHLTHEHYPLIGDRVYFDDLSKVQSRARKGGMTREMFEEIHAFHRQALHAKKIRFIHPETEEELGFSAEFPDDMQDVLDRFRK